MQHARMYARKGSPHESRGLMSTLASIVVGAASENTLVVGRRPAPAPPLPPPADPAPLAPETPSEPLAVMVWFHDARTASEEVILERLPPGVRRGDVCELVARGRAKGLVFVAGGDDAAAGAAAGVAAGASAGAGLASAAAAASAQPAINGAPASPAGPGTAAGGAPAVAASPATAASGGSASGAASAFGAVPRLFLPPPLQSLLDLPPRTPAHIRRVPAAAASADTVEITIRDTLLARDSMWSLGAQLVGTCVHCDKRVAYLGSRCGVVRAVYRRGRAVFLALVGPDTDVIFRLELLRLCFLVQLSREMWHFEETGEIVFHKLVNTLLPRIFQRWRDRRAHHLITIVLFALVDLTRVPWTALGAGERPHARRDFFRVVVDQVNVFHWDRIMASLRLEFANFKRDVLQRRALHLYAIEGDLLPLARGNVLEAINMALMLVADRFGSPDLKHLLTHFVVVTPGTGLFDVDRRLMAATSAKMLRTDLLLDIVCLSQPPLHIVPLFRFRDGGAVTHCVPNWCDILFFKDLLLKLSQWVPRCKIYELQMMGVMEREAEAVARLTVEGAGALEAMDRYDEGVFARGATDRPRSDTRAAASAATSTAASAATSTAASAATSTAASIATRAASSTTAATSAATAAGGVSSLSLIWNNAARSSAATADVATTAVGVVTALAVDSGALTTLYSLKHKAPEAPPPARDERHPALAAASAKRPIAAPLAAPLRPHSPFSQRSSPTWSRLPRRRPEVPEAAHGRASSHGAAAATGSASTAAADSAADGTLWTITTNPSKEMHADILPFLRRSRWNGVFPPNIKRKLVKWRSFQLPAALPIVTRVFPAPAELQERYTFQLYDVLLNPDSGLASTFELLRQMVRMRLYLGFQVCFGDKVRQAERSAGGAPERVVKVLPAGAAVAATLYLSFDDEIHRIAYDTNISVQLYRRRGGAGGAAAVADAAYHPLVRTRYADEYAPYGVDVLERQPKTYNWNQFDQLLAGFDDAMPAELQHFHRMKFVVMPAPIPKNGFNVSNDSLSEEEVRMEGLRKLVATIERGSRRGKKEELPEIGFYTGDLADYLVQAAPAAPPAAASAPPVLNRLAGLPQLAQALQGPHGLALVDRTWHAKVHRRCFLGNELVLWLLKNVADIDTRDDATQFGQELKQRGLFSHVESRHGLLDGHYFYAMEPQYQLSEVAGGGAGANSAAGGGSGSAARGPFLLSSSVRINVDPLHRSPRPETVVVHYDRVHNPDHCYHIRLQWLNTTARFIDDAVTAWLRFCERHGLRLVETPWDELCMLPAANPFQLLVEMELHVSPWHDREFATLAALRHNRFHFHFYLLRTSGFLLDNRAPSLLQKRDIEITYTWGNPVFKYAQYIHRTGTYIVELRDNGNLFLAPNNVHLTRQRTTLGASPGNDATLKLYTHDAQRVMLEFREVCMDGERLREVFRAAQREWDAAAPPPSPETAAAPPGAAAEPQSQA